MPLSFLLFITCTWYNRNNLDPGLVFSKLNFKHPFVAYFSDRIVAMTSSTEVVPKITHKEHELGTPEHVGCLRHD